MQVVKHADCKPVTSDTSLVQIQPGPPKKVGDSLFSALRTSAVCTIESLSAAKLRATSLEKKPRP